MLPKVVLVTVSVAGLQPMQLTMSGAIEASLPEVEATVARLVGHLLESGLSSGA